MKTLENLHWTPRWVSHLGCLKGCLEYLNSEVSDAWLFGGTGHAFVINLHQEVCPSGPTTWNTSRMVELGKNLGYTIDSVFAFRGQGDLADGQARAWEFVRQAIDAGRPCYGWELEITEFYVVYGYDDVGHYYSGPGCDEGKGPKPWQALGDTEIGVIELYSVDPGRAADDATTVHDALSFALEHAGNPDKWIFEGYRAGLDGFDNWIRALQEGRAGEFGTRYNAGVWLECRRFAVGFLQEAQDRLAGRAAAPLGEALTHYGDVSRHLARVSEIYPFVHDAPEDHLPVDEQSRAAVEALQAARKAEAAGLKALERVVRALE